jgi:hypothetical protein
MAVDVLGQLVCSWFKIVQIVPKKLFSDVHWFET